MPEFIDRQLNTPYATGSIWYMQGPFNPDVPKEMGYQLPIFTIEELQPLAFDLVGKPKDIPMSDKDEDIVAIVEYRDGSILDVVRKPL